MTDFFAVSKSLKYAIDKTSLRIYSEAVNFWFIDRVSVHGRLTFDLGVYDPDKLLGIV